MKITVANPPAYIGDHTRHFIQSGSRWSFSMDAPKGGHKFPHYTPYPFSLGFATAMLSRSGHELDAFDGCALDMDEREWIDRIEKHDPNFLITEIPTISFPLMLKALDQLDCGVAIAGSHVTALPQECPSNCRKLEGEWETKMPFSIKNTPETFADYPRPNRKFFPNEQYSNFEFYRPSAQILASRACKFRCIFCIERQILYPPISGSGREYRFRRPRDVVDEMIALRNQGVKQIHFDDMDLTSNAEYVDALCTEILKQQVDLPWTCLGDLATDEATILMMADAGCMGFSFGIETINKKTLHLIGKSHVTPQRIEMFIDLLERYKIHSTPTYQLGLPEKESEMQKTIDYAFQLPTDSLQFSIATPFPGTPFYRLCEREGWLRTKDWTMYDGARNSVLDYPWITHDKIEELHRYAMQRRADEERGFRK